MEREYILSTWRGVRVYTLNNTVYLQIVDLYQRTNRPQGPSLNLEAAIALRGMLDSIIQQMETFGKFKT